MTKNQLLQRRQKLLDEQREVLSLGWTLDSTNGGPSLPQTYNRIVFLVKEEELPGLSGEDTGPGARDQAGPRPIGI